MDTKLGLHNTKQATSEGTSPAKRSKGAFPGREERIRLLFLDKEDYETLGKHTKGVKMTPYDHLKQAGYEHLHLPGMRTVFLPEKYRPMLLNKAKKAEPLAS